MHQTKSREPLPSTFWNELTEHFKHTRLVCGHKPCVSSMPCFSFSSFGLQRPPHYGGRLAGRWKSTEIQLCAWMCLGQKQTPRAEASSSPRAVLHEWSWHTVSTTPVLVVPCFPPRRFRLIGFSFHNRQRTAGNNRVHHRRLAMGFVNRRNPSPRTRHIIVEDWTLFQEGLCTGVSRIQSAP